MEKIPIKFKGEFSCFLLRRLLAMISILLALGIEEILHVDFSFVLRSST